MGTIFIIIWGTFFGYMTAKTTDYNTCLREGHPESFCKEHYSATSKIIIEK